MGQPHAPKSDTSGGLIKTGPGVAHEISLAPAAATATLIAYDNTAGSGTIICQLQAAANGMTARYSPNGGVVFSKGLYIAITGAGAAYNAAID